MTAAVQQLLATFDTLSESDKHEAFVELLRRLPGSLGGDLADETLVEAAAVLFDTLDAEESDHAAD